MLILTSHGNEMAAVAALKSGALDYVVKSPEIFADMPRILTRNLNQWALIHENKKAQQDLQVSEKNFRNSMDNSPLGIRIVSENGETLYANRAFLNIYGYKDVAEFKNTPVKDRYTTESYVEFSERREKRRRRTPLPDNYEVSIVRKDGTVRQLQVMRKEILWGGEKQYQTIYQDVTERNQAETALKKSEEFLNNIIENTPNATWVSDEKGTIIRMNQALRDLLKISDEEIIGKYNVFKDTQVIEQGYLPLIKSVFEEGKTISFTLDYSTSKERQVTLKEPTHKVLEIVISAVKDQKGKVTHAIAQEKDITERQQMTRKINEQYPAIDKKHQSTHRQDR
jgi:PAS domain S-box-containing protein